MISAWALSKSCTSFLVREFSGTSIGGRLCFHLPSLVTNGINAMSIIGVSPSLYFLLEDPDAPILIGTPSESWQRVPR